MSEDLRASALLDQLNEIDKRETATRKWRTTWKQRAWHLALLAFLLLLLDWNGTDILLPGLILAPALLGFQPVARFLVLRRFDRERARLNAVYEEIDRAKALGLVQSPPGDG